MGVFGIQGEHLQAFGPDDIAVLQVTVAQIAVAVHTSRSYSEMMRLSMARNSFGFSDLLS
jgi:GAF domain-containing protein